MASNSWAYAILGLNQRSNPDAKTIRAQFHTLSLKFHPDKHQGSGEAKATARFQDILKAYEHLMHQKVTCEEVIEEKAEEDRSDIQPAKMQWRDRQNGHFKQGDENREKLDGRQARAMHRKLSVPRSGRVTKAHCLLKRMQREERQQRAMEIKKYAPKSRKKTARIKKETVEPFEKYRLMHPNPGPQTVDIYRKLNALSRQMEGAKPLRPDLFREPADEEGLHDYQIREIEREIIVPDFKAAYADLVFRIPKDFVDPLTKDWWDPMLKTILAEPETQDEWEEYKKHKPLREGLKAWRKSCAIPQKSKNLTGEVSADKEDLRVPEYVKRYILEELVEDSDDDEILGRELDCIEWREDVDSWEFDHLLPVGFQLEQILPTGFKLANLPTGFEVDVALPIGFKVLDAPVRKNMMMVEDDMVGPHGGKREIFKISDLTGVNMKKLKRKIIASGKEKERKAARKAAGQFFYF